MDVGPVETTQAERNTEQETEQAAETVGGTVAENFGEQESEGDTERAVAKQEVSDNKFQTKATSWLTVKQIPLDPKHFQGGDMVEVMEFSSQDSISDDSSGYFGDSEGSTESTDSQTPDSEEYSWQSIIDSEEEYDSGRLMVDEDDFGPEVYEDPLSEDEDDLLEDEAMVFEPQNKEQKLNEVLLRERCQFIPSLRISSPRALERMIDTLIPNGVWPSTANLSTGEERLAKHITLGKYRCEPSLLRYCWTVEGVPEFWDEL